MTQGMEDDSRLTPREAFMVVCMSTTIAVFLLGPTIMISVGALLFGLSFVALVGAYMDGGTASYESEPGEEHAT